MSDGAFNQTFMTGDEYVKWVADAEKLHEGLMKDGRLPRQDQLIADESAARERMSETVK